MKKIFTIAMLTTAFYASAASVTIERVSIDVLNSMNDQTRYSLSVRQNIQFQSNLSGHVSLSNTQSDNGKLGIRLEAGLTPTTKLLGNVRGYTRLGIGQKFSNSDDLTYYSIESGVRVPIGQFTLGAGWRYRSAINRIDGDQTNTARLNLSYDINKLDRLGLKYDRMRGDSDSNSIALNYTRRF
jgi:hypothetical protein